MFSNYNFIKIFSKTVSILFIFSLALSAGFLEPQTVVQAQSTAPVNPNATADAKNVLNYLSSLPSKTDNKVVSGQQFPVAAFGTGWTDYQHHIVDLNTQTGKWVGMVGIDYIYGTDSQIATAQQHLIDYWKAGGLVTVNWHAKNPWTGGGASDRSNISTLNLNDLLTSGTAVNTTWMQMLDQTAARLAVLRDNGVVVLWRPFHEMNGNTFWWARNTYRHNATDYINLWKHMYNYFTNTKGLNNLLWVYSPNVQYSTGADPTDYYYPGANYVDIVAEDVYDYNNDGVLNNINDLGSYDKLIALGKPFGLGEVGPWGTILQNGTWDNMQYINNIRTIAPKSTFFQVWSSWPGPPAGKNALIDTQNARALLTDPWVVTRDEINYKSALLLNKQADKTDVKSGDTITYTITYTNGNSAINNLRIEDPIPLNTTFSSVADGGTYDSLAKKVYWNFASINASVSGSVHFTVKAN